MKNSKGQSTIEFLLTFTVAVGFIFLFLKMAMNYTNGYMVHHANFMAARAYLVSDAERQADADNDQAAEATARKVFKAYMPEQLLPEITAGSTKAYHPYSTGTLPIFTGIVTEFTTSFTVGFLGGKDPIHLVSEAFLGREPTRTESNAQTCKAIMDIGLNSCAIHTTLDDNGG